MAASMQTGDRKSYTDPESALKSLVIQFFEMVPIRRVKWESGTLSSQNLDVQTQREVLNRTLKSELCKRYPPALGYRKAFMKKLLHVLEEYGVEICDEIYEVYTEILQESDKGEDLCYKTYTVEGALSYHVTLQESVNIVSFGTTGLCTWQAAQHLSEWIIQNSQLLHKKNVLELGSGLGLTGIITCKQCQVKSYTFTDLHRQVLQLLANNIHRNLSQTDRVPNKPGIPHTTVIESDKQMNPCETAEDSCLHSKNLLDSSESNTSVSVQGGIVQNRLAEPELESELDVNSSIDRKSVVPDQPSGDIGGDVDESVWGDGDGVLNLRSDHWERHDSFNTYLYKGMPGVRMARLDWENLDEPLMEHLSDVDIVLAADVVYDTRIIPHLVLTLKQLLYSNCNRQDPTCAYLSSTIRNEDTRDQFLIALSSEGLNYQQIEGPQLQIFHYDKTVPIEILKITAAEL